MLLYKSNAAFLKEMSKDVILKKYFTRIIILLYL